MARHCHASHAEGRSASINSAAGQVLRKSEFRIGTTPLLFHRWIRRSRLAARANRSVMLERMKLTFWGAAQTVTGSMHHLEVNGKRYLLDCGLYQGRRKEAEQRNRNFPFRCA